MKVHLYICPNGCRHVAAVQGGPSRSQSHRRCFRCGARTVPRVAEVADAARATDARCGACGASADEQGQIAHRDGCARDLYAGAAA